MIILFHKQLWWSIIFLLISMLAPLLIAGSYVCVIIGFLIQRAITLLDEKLGLPVDLGVGVLTLDSIKNVIWLPKLLNGYLISENKVCFRWKIIKPTQSQCKWPVRFRCWWNFLRTKILQLLLGRIFKLHPKILMHLCATV